MTKRKIYFFLLFFLIVALVMMGLMHVSSINIALFSVTYIWLWALISEDLREQAMHKNYRFSFLKLIYTLEKYSFYLFSFLMKKSWMQRYHSPLARGVPILIFALALMFFSWSGDILFSLFPLLGIELFYAWSRSKSLSKAAKKAAID